MTRLLEYPPIYCSSCFCQNSAKRHVDFEAMNDQGYGDDPNNKVPYDWLFLCEDCLREGAELIGMETKDNQEVANLRTKVDRLEREARQAQNYADRLEDAFQHRVQPIELDHRRKPRQIKEPA